MSEVVSPLMSRNELHQNLRSLQQGLFSSVNQFNSLFMNYQQLLWQITQQDVAFELERREKEAEIERLRAEIECLKATNGANVLGGVEGLELGGVEAAMEKLAARCEATAARNVELECQCKAKNELVVGLRRLVDKLAKKCSAKDEEISRLGACNNELSALVEAKAATNAELEAEVRALGEEVLASREREQKLRSEASRREEIMTSLKKDCDIQEKAIETLKRVVNTNKTDLHKVKSGMEEQLAELRTRTARTINSIRGDMAKDMNHLRMRLTNAEEKLKAPNGEAKVAPVGEYLRMKKMSQMEDMISALRREVKDKETQVAVLSSTLCSMTRGSVNPNAMQSVYMSHMD